MTISVLFSSKYGEFRTFFIPKKFFVGFALPLFLSQYSCIIKKKLRFFFFWGGGQQGEFYIFRQFLKPNN